MIKALFHRQRAGQMTVSSFDQAQLGAASKVSLTRDRRCSNDQLTFAIRLISANGTQEL
jgi:hypothetical protein